MEASIQGIKAFLEENEELIDAVRDAGEEAAGTLSDLFERLKAQRAEAEDLVERLGALEFAVGPTADVRLVQKRLLEEIGELGKKIHMFRDVPSLAASFKLARSRCYLELANTFNESARQIIQFTPEEVSEYRVLLRRATLDAEARQRKADLLDGAVQLSKLGLRMGIKLTTFV